MSKGRTLRTRVLVRQAYAWCLAYFVVKAVSWFLLPEFGDALARAGPKMLPISVLITAIAFSGWVLLRRHPDLLGHLLTALLGGHVVATLVAVGIPVMAPILMMGLILFDYLVPVFLALAAWSASRVLAKAERDATEKRPGRVRLPPISLEGYEAPDEEDER